MKLLSRILFWLSLFGAALAMIAPLVFGGASYREAQPAFLALLVLTAIFGRLAIPERVAPPRIDPNAHATRRRNTRLFQWVATLLVIGFASAMELGVAYTELDALRSAAHPNLVTLDDVATGSWTGVMGLCIAGLALLMTIVVRASRVPAPHAPIPYAYFPQRSY